MRVLVTGAAGFIGSTVCEALVREGHDVQGLDSFTNYYNQAVKRHNVEGLLKSGNFKLTEGDINHLSLDEEFAGTEVVIHQAGQPGVRASWGDGFRDYTANNVDATQKLLEWSRRANVSRFVYASSSSIYGDAERYPTGETDLPSPKSPYGVTKLAAEHLCALYASNFSLPTVSLRYFTVYGPRQRPDMAFNRFISRALADEPIHVFGTGEQVREFTHVSDIVRANILAIQTPLPPGTVMNLSGGSAISVNDVLAILGDIHKRPLRVTYEARATGDVMRTGGSTTRARSLLRWEPRIAIGEGLQSEYEWLYLRTGRT